MHRAFVLAALVVALAAAATVTVKNCNDGACTSGCQTQSFTAGQCLEEQGSSNTVQLTCPSPAAMCNNLEIFQDATCQGASKTLANNVCDSCQQNFTVSCGALHDAIFVASNCADTACQTCNNVTIVPFQKCVAVPALGYAYVTSVASCSAVTFTTFAGASCSGSSYVQSYASGQCFDGTVMTCS